MAEILTAAKPGKRKMHSTKVDLTPMVDLGFLLITFFVFTASLMGQKALSLVMPNENGSYTPIPKSGAVTLIATANNIWYYEGMMPNTKDAMQYFSFGAKDSLRMRLMQLRQALIRENGNDDKMMLMLKPANNSNLNQLVELLDEMTICNIRRYAIVDISAEEENIIKN